MRHNPAAGAIVIMLRTLKMHGMAQAVGELTEQGSPAFEGALPILSQLLKAETADREVRSTAYQLKAARFPAYRDLAGFDFASSEVNEALMRQLHRCEFLEDAHNVVLVGGPGTGKTHLATAIGVQAASDSSRLSNSSTRSNKRSCKESLDRSPGGSPTPISSYSMNSATCHSAPPVERCSSIYSASSTSGPASSSRRT
jgi:hypothetical protein